MGKSPRNIAAAIICLMLAACATSSAFSQSQALDGQIEGFVYDQNGSAVPRATVIATNTSTGFVRNILTDEIGFYRMVLLPLGTYSVAVEAPNSMRAVREGVTVVTGQSTTIDFTLSPGEVVETVTVTADGPIADAGKTDLGRVMTNRETANLPLVSRNPLNFVLQQANVNGRPNRGFLQFPVLSANGFKSRVNYQLDGNTATHAGRAGVRLMVIPETFVKEVSLVSNAFAAEFGNTPGVIMNMVTPSATNSVDGSIAYLFRVPYFYTRPFGYSSPEKLQDSRVNDVAFRIGMPLVKDRWHLFGAYEQYAKDDKGIPNRLLTIAAADKAALIAAGLPASIFPPAVPTLERGNFMLLRSDLQLNDDHRLAVRFNRADIFIENNISGGLNTLERSLDVTNVDDAIAVQLASYSTRIFNELRFQFVERKSDFRKNKFSGSGPTIVISNVANFGTPEGSNGEPINEKATQVQDNVTLTHGSHVSKFGGGFLRHRNTNVASIFARYTFPSVQAFVDARNGTNPRSYTRYDESSGDPSSSLDAVYWNLFAQDDWKVNRRLKLALGLRYDLYKVPVGDPSAPLSESRQFKVDKDNFAPRVAAVYALRQGKRPTILRVGAGMYYETPWLDMYEQAARVNGDPSYFSFSLTPQSPSAPAFPSVFLEGVQLPTQDIDTVAADFENLYAVHANLQLEQTINENASVAVAYVRTAGRHIAVYRSINYIPIGLLADDRPVFSPLVNSATRVDPRFNDISIAESGGSSRYDALTLQFTAPAWMGAYISASYTLAKATDDTPEQNISFPNPTNTILSNPYDRSYDRGRAFSDQRHTFAMTLIARPHFEKVGAVLGTIFNNNQIGVIANANSGSAFNIVSNLDLNNDGLRQDRPIGIERNSGTTPPVFNMDLRYSRTVPIGEKLRLELFAEFTNVFNINGIVQFNNVAVPTNISGELMAAQPDFRTRNQSTFQESRQTQLGVKFHF